MDCEGFLPITLIASFHRIQALTTNIAIIIESIKDSTKIELVDGFKVRTKVEPTKWPILDPNMGNSDNKDIDTNRYMTNRDTVINAMFNNIQISSSVDNTMIIPIAKPLPSVPSPPLPRNFQTLAAPKSGALPPEQLISALPVQEASLPENLKPEISEIVPGIV